MSSSPNLERWRAERRALLALLARVEREHDPRLPSLDAPELAGVFADEDAVLAALARRWSRTLEGYLDEVLDVPPGERDRAAERVVARLAAREPALHAVLHHYRHHPAIARVRARDRTRAGLTTAAVHGEHVAPRYLVRRVADPSARPGTGRSVPGAARGKRCPLARARTWATPRHLTGQVR